MRNVSIFNRNIVLFQNIQLSAKWKYHTKPHVSVVQLSSMLSSFALLEYSLGRKYSTVSKHKVEYSSEKKKEYTGQDILHAQEWLDKLTVDSFPRHIYSQQFSRSSGPGGQNVNKLNTKCTLTIANLKTNPGSWMPQIVLDQLLQGNVRNNYKNTLINTIYSEKKDALIIQSDRERSREMNKTDCLNKIIDLFRKSFFIEGEISEKDVKKWENIKKSTNEHRLKNKKFNKDKKQSRKKLSLDF